MEYLSEKYRTEINEINQRLKTLNKRDKKLRNRGLRDMVFNSSKEDNFYIEGSKHDRIRNLRKKIEHEKDDLEFKSFWLGEIHPYYEWAKDFSDKELVDHYSFLSDVVDDMKEESGHSGLLNEYIQKSNALNSEIFSRTRT